VPKAVTIDDATPRRRRGSIKVDARSKASSKAKAERGLLMRVLLRSPKDTVAALLAFAAIVAIVANALFLQAGHHPSPMFGAATPLPLPVAMSASVSPLPRPRPSEADSIRDDVRANETGSIEVKDTAPTAHQVKVSNTPHGSASKPAVANSASRNDPLGDLITSSRRVTGVQRALTKYGYGQLKPTGTIGSDTQAAIQRFERDRKLPVTGRISDRLVRELAAVTGQAID